MGLREGVCCARQEVDSWSELAGCMGKEVRRGGYSQEIGGKHSGEKGEEEGKKGQKEGDGSQGAEGIGQEARQGSPIDNGPSTD